MNKINKRRYSRIKNLFYRMYEREIECLPLDHNEPMSVDESDQINLNKDEIKSIKKQIKYILCVN